jgi:hypothetical protein
MSESPKANKLDAAKLTVECVKHLATLSTGSILLVVAFLEKLFKVPKLKWCIVVSLAAFVLTILTSLVLFFISVQQVEDDFANQDSLLTSVVFLGMFGAFVIGIVSLVIFFVANLYAT